MSLSSRAIDEMIGSSLDSGRKLLALAENVHDVSHGVTFFSVWRVIFTFRTASQQTIGEPEHAAGGGPVDPGAGEAGRGKGWHRQTISTPTAAASRSSNYR